jgi:hypothetical protein
MAFLHTHITHPQNYYDTSIRWSMTVRGHAIRARICLESSSPVAVDLAGDISVLMVSVFLIMCAAYPDSLSQDLSS